VKKLFVIMVLICSLPISALAAVPNEITYEERDGHRYIVKTFEQSPEEGTEQLLETPFEMMGYSYALFSLTKADNHFEDSREHTEIIMIETATNDLQELLVILEPAIEYNYGGYMGILNLDHTTIKTEAIGYSAQYYGMEETKVFPNLDRNDPGYIEKSITKNGVPLTLSSVDWSVNAVDEDMNPISYTATAYYSGGYSANVADGYITTASYSGKVEAKGVSSVTYTVTYVGQEIKMLVPTATPIPTQFVLPSPAPIPEAKEMEGVSRELVLYVLLSLAGVILLAALVKVAARLKRNARICARNQQDGEVGQIARCRISTRTPVIDVSSLAFDDSTELVIEIEAKTAAKLYGRIVTVKRGAMTRTHLIEKAGGTNYWFSVSPFAEEIKQS